MRYIKRSVSLKTIIAIVGAVLAIQMAFLYFHLAAGAREVRQSRIEAAYLVGETILGAFRGTMLAGHKDQVVGVLAGLRTQRTARELRILDSTSQRIVMSADSTEVGKRALASEEPPAAPAKPVWTVSDVGGRKELTVWMPIRNNASCHRCHGRAKSVLGILQLAIDVGRSGPELPRNRALLVWSTVATIALVSGAVAFSVLVLVNQPLKSLISTMKRVAAGDLDCRAKVAVDDELGEAASALNTMADQLLARIRQLTALHNTAERIRGTQDADERERIAIEGIRQATGFDRVIFLNVDPENNTLEGRAAVGAPVDLVREIRLPIDPEKCVLSRTVVERHSMTVRDLDSGLCVDPDATVTCWDYHECTIRECPSYGKTTPRCWRVSGTYCHSGRQHTVEDKMQVCANCEVLRLVCNGNAAMVLLMLGTSEFAAVPLMVRDAVIGVVIVDNPVSRRAITQDAVAALEVFAEQTALALDNARLYSRLQQRVEAADEALKQRMADLVQMENFNQGILRSMSSGLLVVDLHGNLVTLNPAVANMLQLPMESARGRAFAELTRSEDMDLPTWLLAASESSGESRQTAVTLRTANGKELPAEISASPLRDEKGGLIGIIAIVTDLTARREMERQIQRMDRLATLGQLAAGLAHEIKNPLGSIANAVQVLKATLPEADSRRRIFDEIANETQKMDRSMRDFLLFARPKQPRRCPADMNGAAASVLALVEKQAEQQRVSIEARYAEDLPEVMVDPEQIGQVLLNIVLNALQAMEDGGGVLRLRTRQTKESQRVEVEVADTGTGMDTETLKRIFEPYFTTKPEGTGLGLAIAQRAVEDNDGTLRVDSQPGRGTTFVVGFPALNGKGGV